MKVMSRLVMLAVLCIGLVQIVRPNKQPVVAYKAGDADTKNYWTVIIQDFHSNEVISQVEFKRDTKSLAKSHKWKGQDLHFDFGPDNSKSNSILAYKLSLKETEKIGVSRWAEDGEVVDSIVKSYKTAPPGSKIKITKNKITIVKK